VFSDRVADVIALITLGMRTLRCPVCGLTIRYRGVSPAEEERLTAQAAAHLNTHL
jgi:hypothetical protein